MATITRSKGTSRDAVTTNRAKAVLAAESSVTIEAANADIVGMNAFAKSGTPVASTTIVGKKVTFSFGANISDTVYAEVHSKK